MEDFEQKSKAEFNMAVSYLNRINVLLSACDEASINLNMFAWFHSLCATYRELSTWMDEGQIRQFNSKIHEINPKLKKTTDKMNRSGVLDIPSELYMELHTFEMDLRQVANKSGLLMKMTEDRRFGL